MRTWRLAFLSSTVLFTACSSTESATPGPSGGEDAGTDAPSSSDGAVDAAADGDGGAPDGGIDALSDTSTGDATGDGADGDDASDAAEAEADAPIAVGTFQGSVGIVKGGVNVQSADRVAVDPAGGLAVSGSFRGSLDLGLGAFDDSGTQGPCGFVARWDAQGAIVWSQKIGLTQDLDAPGLAIGTDGTLFHAGNFAGAVDLGDGPVTSAANGDAFVAAWDAKGKLAWKYVLGQANGYVRVGGLSLAPGGDVWVGGTVQGAATLGTYPFGTTGDNATWVARLSPAGDVRWVTVLSGAGGTCRAVLGTDDDGVAVAGDFIGTFTVGNTTLTAQPSQPAFDPTDAYVFSLASDGSPRWAHAVSNTARSTSPEALARSSEGGLWLAGRTTAYLPDDSFNDDALMMRLDRNGTETWSRIIGPAPTREAATAVAGLSTGGAAFTLDAEGSVLIDGTRLDTRGSNDVVIVRVQPDGTVDALTRAGDAQSQSPHAAAALPTDDVWIAGTFQGSLDLVTPPLVSQGDFDLFLVRGRFQ